MDNFFKFFFFFPPSISAVLPLDLARAKDPYSAAPRLWECGQFFKIFFFFLQVFRRSYHWTLPAPRTHIRPPSALGVGPFFFFFFFSLSMSVVPAPGSAPEYQGMSVGPAPAADKSLDQGLTFNRSQRGSCSATYETLTQNQVVCK